MLCFLWTAFSESMLTFYTHEQATCIIYIRSQNWKLAVTQGSVC